MSESLSYPIGRFTPPEIIDEQIINTWIEEIAELPKQMKITIEGLSPDQLNTPYRPGGWTILQVINHASDSHINGYMRFHWAMTESNPLIKAYDQNAWTTLSYHNQMPISISLELLVTVHLRWVYLLKSLTFSDLERTFVYPSDGQIFNLKTTIGKYAWHGKHHLAHIVNLIKRMEWQAFPTKV